MRVRLRADVPLAMELSGGLDSASLVALRASDGGAERFPVYTVKMDDPALDEEPLARAVAARWPRRVDYCVVAPPLNSVPSDMVMEPAVAVTPRVPVVVRSPVRLK